MHLEHLLKGQMQMTIQKEGLKNGKMKGRGLWLHGRAVKLHTCSPGG